MRKERPFLQVSVGDEPEGSPLQKDSGLIVDGAVLEGERRAHGDLAAMSHLHAVSRSDDVAVLGAHLEEAVDGSLDKADRDELRRILDRRARPPCARQ